jgi:hypothetical protein
MGLMSLASCRRLVPVRAWSRQLRTCSLIFFTASLLTAGWKGQKMLPFFALAARGRKVYPRNVNSVQGNSLRRLESWQYTSLVLSGCKRSPTSAILWSRAAQTRLAWDSASGIQREWLN